MERDRLRNLLDAMQGKSALVLGDVMVDEFLYGKVDRISPEAPVPVLEFSSHTFMPGGAANVARSVQGLGGRPLLVGCIGQDAVADRLKEELHREAIDDAGLVSDPDRPTTLKTRVVAHTQQVVRIDREDSSAVSPEVEAQLIAAVEARLAQAGVVLISDYRKGAVTAALLRSLLDKARSEEVPVLADSKATSTDHYHGVTVATPNVREVQQLTGVEVGSEDALAEAARRLIEQLECGAVVVTRAEEGLSLFERNGRATHVPAIATEVHDVTGAGDTVTAAMGLALAGGAELPEAAFLANLAAAVVVRKVGTATASPDEIIEIFHEVR